MMKKLAVLIASVVICGCATKYMYEGQKYDSPEKLYSAVDTSVSRVLATITPLHSPLSKKKLVFAMPSLNAFTEQGYKDYVTAQGKEPTDRQKEVGMNLNRANYKSIKVFFDAVQKKNIYASTQFIETESTNASFAASSDTDTLYMVYNGRNSTQWFYTSHRYGKQIFAYDRSSPTPEGKVQAFVDAVQAQAIRD